MGREITQLGIREQPHVLWIAENDQLYTLVLTGKTILSVLLPKLRVFLDFSQFSRIIVFLRHSLSS